MEDFATCWEGLEDPRTGNARPHDFHELLTMAPCAVLCGAQGAADMALFATSKEPFLRGFLKLEKEGSKGSLRGTFKRAGWNDAFLSSLLAAF